MARHDPKIDHLMLAGALEAGMTYAEIAKAIGNVTASAVQKAAARLPKRALLAIIRKRRPSQPVVVERAPRRASELPALLQSSGDRLDWLFNYLMEDMGREDAFYEAVIQHRAKATVSSAGTSIAAPDPPTPAPSAAGGSTTPAQTAAPAPAAPVPPKPVVLPPRIAAGLRVSLMTTVEEKRIRLAEAMLKANEHFIRLAGFEKFIAEFHAVLAQPKYDELRREFVAELVRQGLFHLVTEPDAPPAPAALPA